jgi:hypothetical protein
MHPNLAIIAQNRLGASPKNGISLEGIIIFLEKILAKTPNPELLRSIPVPKKVKAIRCIAPPTTRKQVQSFIGLINYYQDMWPRRSEILAPLTRLTSKDVPFQWTDVKQQAFDKMKAIVCCEVLLLYPDFNKPFHIHTDASHYQLGAVISQDKHPIAFYSRKLQPAQIRYTTRERELLLIIET